jgi:hypothetical protein
MRALQADFDEPANSGNPSKSDESEPEQLRLDLDG